MDNHKINDYIRQLEIELEPLPKKDRDNHIMEVKDHLLQSVTNGKSVDQVLKSFLPANELAKEIKAEYQYLYSAPSAENIPSIKQKNSKILRNTVIVLLGIIIFAIFVAIAVFMGNSSDKPTDTNGIVEYEEIRN
ncbi:hypothetical protein GY31_06840 [Lysinibacillus sphaericus]|uniref:DUF1700 domain-containing protein n=1 Tax=Lysinibacillus TaxID=400634 RepID=UPI00084AB2FA|nr:DUF1700 domain-containing protein [Lysinibacillus sphaericus]OEC02753.1 hypothetical protein GY31_06840 [Lysinibacillus sphaericus]